MCYASPTTHAAKSKAQPVLACQVCVRLVAYLHWPKARGCTAPSATLFVSCLRLSMCCLALPHPEPAIPLLPHASVGRSRGGHGPCTAHAGTADASKEAACYQGDCALMQPQNLWHRYMCAGGGATGGPLLLHVCLDWHLWLHVCSSWRLNEQHLLCICLDWRLCRPFLLHFCT